jgi:hypothetical protein
MNVTDTLVERGKLYGSFAENARLSQAIKCLMSEEGPNWPHMRPDQREALEAIAAKIARLLNGDPLHFDSWHDIAGYATLIADTLAP